MPAFGRCACWFISESWWSMRDFAFWKCFDSGYLLFNKNGNDRNWERISFFDEILKHIIDSTIVRCSLPLAEGGPAGICAPSADGRQGGSSGRTGGAPPCVRPGRWKGSPEILPCARHRAAAGGHGKSRRFLQDVAFDDGDVFLREGKGVDPGEEFGREHVYVPDEVEAAALGRTVFLFLSAVVVEGFFDQADVRRAGGKVVQDKLEVFKYDGGGIEADAVFFRSSVRNSLLQEDSMSRLVSR